MTVSLLCKSYGMKSQILKGRKKLYYDYKSAV